MTPNAVETRRRRSLRGVSKGVKRPPRIEGDVAFISLSNGMEMKVDAVDLPIVGGFNWTAAVNGRHVYAYRARALEDGSVQRLKMHRELCPTEEGQVVDHINGDTLDNRRCNLRACTQAQNSTNRVDLNSKYGRGVYKTRGRYSAWLPASGRRNWVIGEFDDPQEAVHARRAGEVALWGPFSRRVAEFRVPPDQLCERLVEIIRSYSVETKPRKVMMELLATVRATLDGPVEFSTNPSEEDAAKELALPSPEELTE